MGKTFTINEKDESLNAAFQLMLGGYIYFTLLSKFNKTFISTDLTSKPLGKIMMPLLPKQWICSVNKKNEESKATDYLHDLQQLRTIYSL
jgi:hypothetical protein